MDTKVAPRKVSVTFQKDLKQPETRQRTSDIEIKINKSTKKLGEKDVFTVTLKNKGEEVIPEQEILFRQNEYYRHALAVMSKVAPYKEVSVELEVDVKKPGTRQITDLCRSFDIHFEKINRTITTETKIGKIKFFLSFVLNFLPTAANYNQGLGDYCPQTLLSRAGKDPNEIKHYNILLFGVAGAGKSSFINTLLTMLQNEDKLALARSAVTGHATQRITRYDVKAVYPYLHFNLWDTWGLDENNYDAYLVGLLTKGKLPPNWTMNTDLEKHADKFDKLLKKETPLTQMHAVIFFVPQESLTDLDTHKMARVRQVFEYIRQEGYNPLVLLSKVDEIRPELHDHPQHSFKEIEKLSHTAATFFDIDLHRVRYTVNYLYESSRKWEIEALAYQNLTAALEMCESFVESRLKHSLKRFGSVRRRDMEHEVKGWKDRLATAYDKAVPLDGDIQLKLAAAKCLTHDQMSSTLPEMPEISFNYSYPDEASGKLGERDYFWIQVVNDGLDEVPRQKLFFEENCYHCEAVAEIGPVPCHTSAEPVTFAVDVKKKGAECTIRHLCKSFVIRFEKMGNVYKGKICVGKAVRCAWCEHCLL